MKNIQWVYILLTKINYGSFYIISVFDIIYSSFGFFFLYSFILKFFLHINFSFAA